MVIYGKERQFKATIGAMADIAKLCPGGDLNRLGEAFTGSFAGLVDTMAAFIVALNKGYEDAMRFENPEKAQQPLTVEEVKSLTQSQMMQLQEAARLALSQDSKTEVEAEPLKKTKA